MNDVNRKAFGGLLFMFLVTVGLVFVPAWTLDYWQAWVLLAVYFGPSVAVTLYLMKKDPQLLQRRMRGGPRAEKEPTQKIIMWFASAGFAGILVVPGIDHRLGWSHMPVYAVLCGDLLMLIAWVAIFWVFRENTFTSATIELAPDQKVISTGPYALVRHPMYTGGIILFLGMPIALGSWWGVLVMGAIVPAIVWRLLDEEKFLAKNLAGYTQYQEKVRYRLLPGIW